MTGSVEGAKDAGKVVAKEAAAARPSPDAKPSPDAQPQAAVPGPDAKAPARSFRNPLATLKLDARLAAAATVALVLGTAFGMVAAPRERTGAALGRIDAALEGSRAETARLNGEVERLMLALAAIRDAGEAARGESKALGSGLADRLTRLEQGLDRKIAALGERLAPTEREQAAASVSPAPEKRAAAPVTTPAVATTPAAATQATPRSEPTQTASLPDTTRAETKAKTETVENWVLREVYDGIAMLEDRKRRLIEVVPGDSVPGLGRVEAIERRGRNWVVVTRQGVITPQTW